MDFNYARIGKSDSTFTRILKVSLSSQDLCDKIVGLAISLHDMNPPVSKIYTKKNIHPVGHKENKRLRDKMKRLKSLDENAEKEIKIINGKLTIDKVIVDQNIFFQ